MRFLNHSETYFERMDSSIAQKDELLDWIPGGSVVELGPGSGWLTEHIAALPQVTDVLALDASAEAIEHLRERFEGDPRVSFREVVLGEHTDPFGGKQFDAIVASSVFHEVYSFIGAKGLMLITSQIADALKPGGRLIIRDGVAPAGYELPAKMELAPRLQVLAERYAQEGPEGLRPTIIGNVAHGARHQIAEMAFTITWGEESFGREVQEQYQVYDLVGGELFYMAQGLELIHSSSFIQSGYMEHLEDSPMSSQSEDGSWAPWFPETNAIWVFEKPRG